MQSLCLLYWEGFFIVVRILSAKCKEQPSDSNIAATTGKNIKNPESWITRKRITRGGIVKSITEEENS